MKKLYRNRKGTVHPSPPTISDHLSFLPAAILALTLSLSQDDREVLAYLISGNPRQNPKLAVEAADHPPLFDCSCFRCYMSYWVRWNSSPNHQLIHQIIDAFEDSLARSSSKPSKKDKRNKRASRPKSPPSPPPSPPESVAASHDADVPHVGEDPEKGSVRRFVSFIGERIWGAWAQ
ncbi:uncharacterized protein LOC109809612 [Cajanus cajan]|uniref:Uncharacterized protein n=1 Tax=Cajanus cajan TaxID=3821 RepID=A0A151SU47_CAJCA|nr:uncharacterized protein LOC109809612 [Cajanus cajan]KYP58289.1 hypothetical protein KK1_004589 [Cajanus cajan]